MSTQATILYEFENYTSKIAATSHRSQWIVFAIFQYADYVSRVILPEVCIKMAMDVFDVSHDEAEHHMALAMEASQDEMSLSQAMEVLKSGGDHSPGCKQQWPAGDTVSVA